MNFGGEDPLADLSDGSNDSFFDDPKPKPRKSNLSKPTTPEKNNTINDLFNINDPVSSLPTETKQKREDDWLGLGQNVKKSPLKSAPKIVKRISFEDDDDLLGNLGLDKHPKTTKKEESNLLDDILKSTKAARDETIKKPTFGDVFKESKAKTSPLLDNVASVPLAEGLREGRRGRRPSGLMDPLGLFSNEAKSQSEEVLTEKKDVKDSPSKQLPTKNTHQSKSTPNIRDQGLIFFCNYILIKLSL